MADGTIELWRVREYEKNVYIRAQQKDSRLAAFAIQTTQHSKLKAFDILGSTEAQERVDLYGDTPNIEVPHNRRAVVLKDYDWGKLIDDMEILRTLNDPTNPYVQIMSNAFMRKKDKIFIAAALGLAREGEEGDTSALLPDAQRIAPFASGALTNLNVECLRHLKYKFDAADVDPDMMKHVAVTPSQIRALLAQTEVTSSDYNTVQALVQGKVDSFMGFKFHVSNLLPVVGDNSFEPDVVKSFSVTTGEAGSGTSSTGFRRCIAWVEDGMRMSTGAGFSAEISKRADKKNINQIYGKMAMGGVRMEDVKVVEINCKES